MRNSSILTLRSWLLAVLITGIAACDTGKEEQAKLRYEEGEEELINLLTIQQRVIGAQSTLSSARRLLLEQRVNLHLALGGSWEL